MTIIRKKFLKYLLIYSVAALVIILYLFLPIPEYLPKIYYYYFVSFLSGLAILYMLYLTARYFRTFTFKKTDAVMLKSEVVRYEDSEGDIYEAVILYKYRIGNSEFTSKRIYPYIFEFKSNFEALARRYIVKYPKGSPIQIFYNPKKPEIAFIERKGIVTISFWLIFFSVIFVLMLSAILGKVEL